MKLKSLLSVGFLATIALFACSGEPALAVLDHPETHPTFDLRKSRDFSYYRSVIGKYLRSKSPRRRTRACVIGFTIDGKDDAAWVIWRGGGRLILWEGGGEYGLNHSSRNLSLSKDVVPITDPTLYTSTYLVSRPWVARLERRCATAGRFVAVN